MFGVPTLIAAVLQPSWKRLGWLSGSPLLASLADEAEQRENDAAFEADCRREQAILDALSDRYDAEDQAAWRGRPRPTI